MTRLIGAGARVNLIGVTDGAAACPPSGLAARGLAATGVREAARGYTVLGADPPIQLMLPDGHVSHDEAWLAGLVEAALTSESVCLATWAFDGHPDHEAVVLKRSVFATHRSQLDPPQPGGSAVLPPFVLDRLITNREMLLP